MKKASFISYCIFFILISFLFSCSNVKNITYFKDLTDTAKIYSQQILLTYKVVLQPDDLIGINISSNNPEATAVFNGGGSVAQIQTNVTATGINSNTNSGAPNTYLIDKQGTIDFPVLGNLTVQGLTVSQLKDSLKIKLTKYLQDPIVNIRLLNYKITVLGEVTRPATYTVSSERITVVDAIGMAGDLTIYGKRENVLLIREENGQRKFVRLNLTSSNLFESPYYYLKQNDIVYVEPNKAKAASLNTSNIRTITLALSVISVLILAYTRLK